MPQPTVVDIRQRHRHHHGGTSGGDIGRPLCRCHLHRRRPFYQAEAFAELAKLIKSRSEKTIWCYTGFTLEQLLRDGSSRELLCNIDVLVDGPFIASKRSEEALFRGSTNQRILMARESALKGEPVHWERPCWDL